MELYFADSEVFAYDTLWAFKRQSDGQIFTFWNDPVGVIEFIYNEQPVLCGYNFRDYDSYILKATLLEWDAQDIAIVSRTIIESDDMTMVWDLFRGQPWVELPPIIDLFHDIVPRKGLKEIEANIGQAIDESSVSFDITRPLTDQEREEITEYCISDLNATESLYALRYDYVRAKMALCELSGLEPLTMLQHTNARIVAEALGAQRLANIPYEEYEIPENIDLSAIPAQVIEYVYSINTDNCMTTAAGKLDFMFCDCPTTFALGGIHAAVPSYQETASEERAILIQDIASFYPSLIINNGYMSRAVSDPSLYKQFYDMRLKAKAEGDKPKAEAAKLVLNTTFGTMKDTYNKMFDPMQGTRVCLSGQLYILDLISKMYKTVPNMQLIQLNTDGWVISCNRSDIPLVERVVAEWSERTNLSVDTAEIQKVVQANVNNYIIRMVDGSIKTKGGVVSNYKGGNFKSNSMTIIDQAVVDYLLDGVPIESTVSACDDLSRFQIIARAGRTFQQVLVGDTPVQRVNRVYASTIETANGIRKVKLDDDGNIIASSRIPLTPDHVYVDNENAMQEKVLTILDKLWYIELAQKKADEFISRDKKEKDQMADVVETHNELAEKPAPKSKAKGPTVPVEVAVVLPTFKEKLLQLQYAMARVAERVSFDNVVSNISYEYADTQQYKKWLAAECTALGLIIKVDFSCSFPESLGKTYGSMATGTVTIGDVTSDYSEVYDICGFGSNVQPGYCIGVAQTNALRNFILNNYLLDNKGRDGDDQAMNAAVDSLASGGFVSSVDKAQIKSGIATAKADDAKYATDMFAKVLLDKVIEAQVFQPSFGEKMVSQHFDVEGNPKLGENGKSTMLKSDAVKGLTKAEEIIAAGANNG